MVLLLLLWYRSPFRQSQDEEYFLLCGFCLLQLWFHWLIRSWNHSVLSMIWGSRWRINKRFSHTDPCCKLIFSHNSITAEMLLKLPFKEISLLDSLLKEKLHWSFLERKILEPDMTLTREWWAWCHVLDGVYDDSSHYSQTLQGTSP